MGRHRAELIQRGASIEAVRLLAGHSAIAVTARYLHATNAELTNAVAKLAGKSELGN